MMTQHHYFLQELESLITAEIERLKDDMSTGLLTSYDEYRSTSGKIAGLRSCLDYMDEATSNVKKKLGA